MTYQEEIKKQMQQLADRLKVRFIGYNTKYGSKAYGTLEGCEDKCIEMPVAENLMVGIAIGMALEGYLPIVWFERHDFILNALDAIVNHLDKIEHLSHGDFNPKVIIRACVGGTKPIYPEVQHIQDYTSALADLCRGSIDVFYCRKKEEAQSVWNSALINKGSSIIIEWRDKYNE